MEEKKLASRKLWAFIIWTVLAITMMFTKFEVPEFVIKPHSVVTLLYILGQSAIDFIKAWKGTDEK